MAPVHSTWLGCGSAALPCDRTAGRPGPRADRTVPSLPPAAPRAPPPHARPPPQLSMLRISPSMGHSLDAGLALRHLLFLLEYCMVTGYDWWDILLHVQPSMVQSLVEKLHEEYTRQKAELQQVPPPLAAAPSLRQGDPQAGRPTSRCHLSPAVRGYGPDATCLWVALEAFASAIRALNGSFTDG